MKPLLLTPRLLEKPWGTGNLEPWFPNTDRKIGEAWYTADDNRASTGETLRELMEAYGQKLLGTAVQPGFNGCFPLLVKMIFTSERLSIQVHPNDEYANRHENSPGKTEMWHIVRALPEARIALGFRKHLDKPTFEASIHDGSIVDLLRWHETEAGDSFFVPAGAVHAIGAGVALWEVQQNSDITYRLYDYGRPRELHIAKSVEVSTLEPHPGQSHPQPLEQGIDRLASSQYFDTQHIVWQGERFYKPDPKRFHLLMINSGAGFIGETPFAAGQCWLVPAASFPFLISTDSPATFLRTMVP